MPIQVAEELVIFLCILGAGALITAIAAFSKSMFRGESIDIVFNKRTSPQDQYLRRVREINQTAIWIETRAQRKEKRKRRAREIREAREMEIYGRGYHGPNAESSWNGRHGHVYQNHRYNDRHVAYYEDSYPMHEKRQAESGREGPSQIDQERDNRQGPQTEHGIQSTSSTMHQESIGKQTQWHAREAG